MASLASEIVSHWRDEVAKQKTAALARKKGSTSPSSDAPSTAKITTPLDRRTWKNDNVDVKRTESLIRNNCVGLLYDGLAFMVDEGGFRSSIEHFPAL